MMYVATWMHIMHVEGVSICLFSLHLPPTMYLSGQLLKEKYYSEISAASSLLTTWLLYQAHKRQDKKLLVITV